jgi:shikimate dehydrogenase
MKCIDNINGKTSVYSVIGCPIGHSFSPVIHNTLANVLEHNLVYTAFEVKSGGLGAAILGGYELGIQGFNVTIPHKQEVMKYLYAIDDLAIQIGAVNTLKYTDKGYKGYNTDFYGLKACFDFRGVSLKDKKVVVIGAGGAARSACIMLAAQEVKKIYIVNRTIENGEDVLQNIKKYYNTDVEVLTYDKLNSIENIDVCIQTTSVGMSPNIEDSPVEDIDFFKKVKVVLDIIFNPWRTKFLEDAQKMGCITINGFDMLYFQAVKSYEIWRNIEIPDDIKKQVKEELELYYTKK